MTKETGVTKELVIKGFHAYIYILYVYGLRFFLIL